MFNLICRIERWKYNKEYDVFVSSEGRLRDKDKKEIFPKISHNYLFYYSPVKSGSRRIAVHRLVMRTFKPIKNYKEMTVDHLNHNTRDNRLVNLEWVEKEENQRRSERDHDIEADREYATNNFIEESNKETKELFVINGVLFDKESAIEMISRCPCHAPDKEHIEKMLNQIFSTRQTKIKKTYGFIIEPYEENLKLKINGFIFNFSEGVDFIYRYNGFSGSKNKLETNLSNFLTNSKKENVIMYNFYIEKCQVGG